MEKELAELKDQVRLLSKELSRVSGKRTVPGASTESNEGR